MSGHRRPDWLSDLRMAAAILWYAPAWWRRANAVRRRLRVMTARQTLDHILSTGCGVSRLGDGEFEIINGSYETFQHPDAELGRSLADVLANPPEGHLVCLQHTLLSRKGLRPRARLFYVYYHFARLARVLAPCVRDWRRTYGDTAFTRFYIDATRRRRRSPQMRRYALDLRRLWQDRDVVVVEGRRTRMGVGNDLLANARSVRRILVPPRDAFDRYDAIRRAILAHSRPGDLVLIAAGPTATILAADLAREGIQAIDIGHVDSEYEWCLRQSRRKEAIPGKAMWEVTGAHQVADAVADPEYNSQIVAVIDP